MLINDASEKIVCAQMNLVSISQRGKSDLCSHWKLGGPKLLSHAMVGDRRNESILVPPGTWLWSE
jgi:hypothetical protein